jgi:hypothetical protein
MEVTYYGNGEQPKQPNSLRFVCISDTHGINLLRNIEIPEGDFLLHSGDFSDMGDIHEVVAFDE